MAQRPNLLFVFPDQLSAAWTSVYGHQVVQTPVLERFAQQATRFTRCYSTSPVCTPFRGCLWTGQYPTATGVRHNGNSLPRDLPTIATRLGEAGYATHYFGKWHLLGGAKRPQWVPPGRRGGFEHFVGWESHHVDHWAGQVWADDPDRPIDLVGHETDGLTDLVCDRLATLGRSGERFAMMVSYQAPHAPCTPPEAYADLYRGRGDLFPEPHADASAHFRNPHWNADYDATEFRTRYFGEVTHLDAAFGRLLSTLAATGLDENTVVVFTSDHGEMNACHSRFGKYVFFREAVEVPLLVRMPGQRSAAVRHDPLHTPDLSETLLALAGAQGGLGPGESFVAALGDAGRPVFNPDRPIVIEYDDLCLIEGHRKLIADRDSFEPSVLFDLENDPNEQQNLVERCGDDVRQMRDRLAALWPTLSTRSLETTT